MSTTSNEYYQDVSQCESPNSRNDKKFKKKSSYKHVPHSDKPPQVVAKRNARERKRVHAVNQAFIRLRKVLPFENKVQPKLLHTLLRKINQISILHFQRGKRISKVRVLQRAIDYINNLHDMVLDHDGITKDHQHQYYHSNFDSSLFAF